jgi:NifU-like protein involved in Fe-S cluster formation
MKKTLTALSLLLLLPSSSFACCGCAIVMASTNLLTATSKATIKEVDMSLGEYFNQVVTKENERYLSSLKNTPRDIQDGTKVHKEMFMAYDKLAHTIKKENNIKSNIK